MEKYGQSPHTSPITSWRNVKIWFCQKKQDTENQRCGNLRQFCQIPSQTATELRHVEQRRFTQLTILTRTCQIPKGVPYPSHWWSNRSSHSSPFPQRVAPVIADWPPFRSPKPNPWPASRRLRWWPRKWCQTHPAGACPPGASAAASMTTPLDWGVRYGNLGRMIR